MENSRLNIDTLVISTNSIVRLQSDTFYELRGKRFSMHADCTLIVARLTLSYIDEVYLDGDSSITVSSTSPTYHS